MFLEKKVMEVPELISDGWLHDCACLVDWTTHKNELNLKLRGKNQLVHQLHSHFKTFQDKLHL
jgi:hypothetical protein